MPTGAAWPNSDNKALWHLQYKINTDNRGFFLNFVVADQAEAAARAVGVDLGVRLLNLLPPDAEIFYAHMSRDDHLRDSRLLPTVIGVGLYAPTGGGGAQTYDQARTSWLFRLESTDGGFVTRKLAPIPDSIVADGLINTAPAAVVAFAGPLPAAPAPGDLWNVIANNFMKAVVLQTHHLQGPHAPGGTYDYNNWINAYHLRIGSKKGGRVFI